MASCQTTRWAGTSPYVKLVVTENASTSTATVSKLNWAVYYISDYPASASARTYTVKVNGSVPSGGTGSYNINGVTGTKLMASGTVSINKTASMQGITFAVSFPFNLTWSGQYKGTLSASGTVTVSAKPSYTITYNANGGSNAPGRQTKVYGTNLTLSSGKPTRSGYIFKGWATTSSGAVAYQPGGTYSSNANITLYAIWIKSTFTVAYNANGGSGAPGNQTKTYGTNLTLSSTKPTKTDYKFIGWGTAASDTTAKYQPGGTYTANANITLYAIWVLDYEKPRITNVSVNRAKFVNTTVGGITIPLPLFADDGYLGLVKFSWATDKTITGINISFRPSISTTWPSNNSDDIDLESIDITDNSDGSQSGEYSGCLSVSDSTSESGSSAATLDPDTTYEVRIIVKDSSGQTTVTRFLNGTVYPIDFLNGTNGTGTAIGKAATLENTFEVGWPTKFTGGIQNEVLSQESDLNNITTPNTYVSLNMSAKTYTNLPSEVTSGTFILEVTSAGGEGQIRQELTTTNKTDSKVFTRYYYEGEWGNWVKDLDTSTANATYQKKHSQKVLWSGAYYMNGNQTITLSEKISAQGHGIVLSFSRYVSGQAQDYAWNNFFVPIQWVNDYHGAGISFMMIQSAFEFVASKYLYISDGVITGHAQNESSGTKNGITYNNSAFVLRAVYGV